jgi:hypothetical protein
VDAPRGGGLRPDLRPRAVADVVGDTVTTVEIECKYRDTCRDYSILCYWCKHRTRKRSYYEPYEGV